MSHLSRRLFDLAQTQKLEKTEENNHLGELPIAPFTLLDDPSHTGANSIMLQYSLLSRAYRNRHYDCVPDTDTSLLLFVDFWMLSFLWVCLVLFV